MRTFDRTRIFLTAALPLAAVQLLHAQDSKAHVKVKVDWEAAQDDGIGVARLVQGDGGCMVAIKTKGGRTVLGGVPQAQLDWSLVSYNTNDMKTIKTDKPKIVWGEGPVALETIETFNHQFRLIATKPDPESAKLLILQQVLSPRGLTGKAASIITELPYDRLGKGADYYQAGMAIGFTTTISADSTKLLLGLTPASTVRSAGCPVFAMVLDKQMKPLWSNTLTTASGAQRVDILDTRVDKNGAVWYLVRNVTDPAPKTKDVLGYSFSLYKLDSAGQQEVVLDLPSKSFAQDMGMDVLADGSIVCAGIYSNGDANRNESIGIFRAKLDMANMKWDGFKLLPYDKQLIKKEERLQTNMKLDHVWARRDGGLFVVTQRSGTETHMVSDLSGKKTAKTEWVYGPMHIMELTPSGELKWYKQIDRDLGYANDGPGAILSTIFNDALFIWYNDTEGNIEKRRNKEAIDPVTSAKDLVMLEFKGDGTDKGKVVLKDGMKQGFFIATKAWRIADGHIGVVASDGFGKDKTYPVFVELTRDQKK